MSEQPLPEEPKSTAEPEPQTAAAAAVMTAGAELSAAADGQPLTLEWVGDSATSASSSADPQTDGGGGASPTASADPATAAVQEATPMYGLPAVTPSPNPAVEPVEESGRVMTVIEHLDELRTRIIRSLFVVILAFLAALAVGKEAVKILEAPAGGIQFQALSLEEPVLVYFKVSFYLAIVLACPWILGEVCQFIGPGLRKNERRILSPIVFGSPLLFAAGAAFAYFCVLPPMLHFFNSFGQGISPIHQRLDFYISLVSSIMLYMGLCFQLPIIIFALALAGLVNSRQLVKIWRYAVFGASVVALIITPDPTAFSMLIVMGALIGLYFLSVLLLKLFGK